RALDKAVTKGVFHRNNAANKKSSMALAFNKLG
ncbi:MAG: 30S ribosomal protein S20, partial [Corynebacterium pollutisoli]|nr:30S ribosomal protein S20 [Corynebacterium pollutisoli]